MSLLVPDPAAGNALEPWIAERELAEWVNGTVVLGWFFVADLDAGEMFGVDISSSVRGNGLTMNRPAAIALLDRLHEAQNEFYAGGSDAVLEQLLAPSITWKVPGQNAIAGTYRGLEEVFDYFRQRRDLANRTFRMTRRDVLVGEGDRIAALTDGAATIRGSEHRWSTVGLYEVIDQRIAACWLLPLDQREFDVIWAR